MVSYHKAQQYDRGNCDKLLGLGSNKQFMMNWIIPTYKQLLEKAFSYTLM